MFSFGAAQAAVAATSNVDSAPTPETSSSSSFSQPWLSSPPPNLGASLLPQQQKQHFSQGNSQTLHSSQSSQSTGVSSTMSANLAAVWRRHSDVRPPTGSSSILQANSLSSSSTLSWICSTCGVPTVAQTTSCPACGTSRQQQQHGQGQGSNVSSSVPPPVTFSFGAAPVATPLSSSSAPTPALTQVFSFGAPPPPPTSFVSSTQIFNFSAPPPAAASHQLASTTTTQHVASKAAADTIASPFNFSTPAPTAVNAPAVASKASTSSDAIKTNGGGGGGVGNGPTVDKNAPKDFFKSSPLKVPSWPSSSTASTSSSVHASPPASSYKQFKAIVVSPLPTLNNGAIVSTGKGASRGNNASSSSSSRAASGSVIQSLVFSCGSGECEQLGHGNYCYSLDMPRLLRSLVRVPIARISVGGIHSIALTTTGEVWSWGCNDDCALGRSGAENVPGRVRGLLNGRFVQRIACGDSHSIALDSEGRVFAWGTYKGADGYLGFDAKTKKQAEPRFLSDVWKQYGEASEVSCGNDHTGVVTRSGQAVVWGYNGQGQLGKAFVEREMRGGRHALLQLVPHLLKIKTLKASPSSSSSVGITAAGEIIEEKAQTSSSSSSTTTSSKRKRGADTTSTSTTTTTTTPTNASSIIQLPDVAPGRSKPKKGEEVVSRIFCVGYSTFVSLVSGRVVACGLNSYGQLGLGHVDNVSEPEEVEGLSLLGGIASITGGNQHVLALSNAGAVFSCGRGDSGQLGIGEVGQRSGAIPVGSSAFSPVQVDPAHFGGSAVVHISANGCSSACVTAKGELYTWGFGDSGQLGNNGGGDENIPYLVNKAAKTGSSKSSSSSSSNANETRGIIIRACGLGGQHLVALGEARGVETLPGGGSVSDSTCEVIEDPEKIDDDDDNGGGGDDDDDNNDKEKEDDEEDEDEEEEEEEEEGQGKKARTE